MFEEDLLLGPVGSEAFFPASEALVSLAVAGNFNTPGWVILLSPSMNSTPFVHTAISPGDPLVQPFEAYLVFMENADTYAGFSFTPLSLAPWALLLD